jgi:hypothetical protein
MSAVTTTVGERSGVTRPGTAQTRSSYRYVWIFLVCSGLALGIAGWIGGALSFSGAEFFFALIEHQALHQPFGRYSTAPFQLPALIASSATSSVVVLRHLFGLGYAVAPFGALLVSWLVVRKRAPQLIVWPVIGITVVCLPGLLCLIQESPIVAEWAWPLLLLTLVALDNRWTLLAAVVLAVFVFFCSANSLGVFVVVAAAALVRAALQPATRRRLVPWGVAMLVAAPLEYGLRNSDFTAPAHKVSLSVVSQEFRVGYFPLPFIAYILAGCACAVILYLRFSSRHVPRIFGYLPTALVVGSGVCLVVYCSTAAGWHDASGPKDILLLLVLPLYVVAGFDQLFRSKKAANSDDSGAVQSDVRVPVVLVAGVTLLLCLGLWSASWSSLMNDASQKLSAATTYCVPVHAIQKPNTALASAYVSELAIDLQTRTPAHVLLDSAGCRVLHDKGVLEIFEFKSHVARGWFHFKR